MKTETDTAVQTKTTSGRTLKDTSKLTSPNKTRISDLKGKVNRPSTKPNIELDVSWGLDPELMLWDVSKNRIASSIPILKRDKHNPIDLGDGAKFYADCTLAEFSMPPEKTGAALVKSMRVVFQKMQDHLGAGYRLIPKAAHEYPAEDLVPSFGVDPTLIGCEPSFSAWLMAINSPGEFNGGLRTGSFHLHLGHKRLTEFGPRVACVKLLDIYLGLASVVFDKDPTSCARRTYYGKASEHRLPPHGVEYRVMGPFALRSPALVELAIDIANYALNAMRQGREDQVIGAVHPEEIQKAINTCDVPLARRILTQLEFPRDLMARVEMDRGELDMYKEWSLKV